MGAASVAVAVDPTIHTAYVISEGDGGSVSVIDETTGTLKSAAAPDHGLGIEPAGLAVDLPTHLVYATFPSIGEVAAFAFDPSGYVANFVKLGGAPTGVAVDHTGGVFVTNGALGRVWVLAAGTVKSISALRVPGALGVAVDTATHVAYVTSPSAGTVSMIQQYQAPQRWA